MNRILYFCLILSFFACQNEKTADTENVSDVVQTAPPLEEKDYSPSAEDVGHIVEMDGGLSDILNNNSAIEVLASGFDWTEGPLWVPALDALLFSDIPVNSVFKWEEGKGVSNYLYPSGYTGSKERTGELGSNGLLLDREGRLVLCQHGDRRIAYMDATLENPHSTFQTIVDKYQNKRFNSPNDAVYDSNFSLYFTDPPYGLEGGIGDAKKELKFQGVYRLSSLGVLEMLDNSMSRPEWYWLITRWKDALHCQF